LVILFVCYVSRILGLLSLLCICVSISWA